MMIDPATCPVAAVNWYQQQPLSYSSSCQLYVLCFSINRLIRCPCHLGCLAVNYYGHCYLTLLLLPKMIESGQQARIVNVASSAEQYGTLDFLDPKGKTLVNAGIQGYARSKLMLLMFTFELQRRLKLLRAEVDAFAVHPGLVITTMFIKVDFRYVAATLIYLWGLIIGTPPGTGARSTIYAAADPRLTGKGGQYIGPHYSFNRFHTAHRKPWNRRAYDVNAWQNVWTMTLETLREVTGQDVPNFAPGGVK
eukprot:GHRR01008990.1.p1 GENE.GHRR01008990.1~~GHRR01008990.1.p1  ORF type:complete len:251 (+),score=62.09 GHRR01008990.1:755-1507(+)